MYNVIAAVSKNYGIGADNDLLYNIPEDKKFFRTMTAGKTVVMGRRTFESLPKKPLPNRVNIVLSSDGNFKAEGVTVCRSMDELKGELEKYPDEEIFIIGGAAVYKAMLPMCGRAYITHIDDEVPADKFFPEIEKLPEWKCTERSDSKEFGGLKYSFRTYERV